MKGVLLAGGTGSRLYPLTRITNKHLLPIGDRPDDRATRSKRSSRPAITEIMVVTGGTHAGEFLRLLSNGDEYGVDRLFYAYQERPGGIAEALGLAERFVGDDAVLVMLADNIFGRPPPDGRRPSPSRPRGARIVLAEVDEPEHLRHLGVPELDADGTVVRIVEKPEDAAEQVLRDRRVLLRPRRVRGDLHARAVRARRARDHRREQPLRRRRA